MKFLVAFALAVACAHADVSHVVGKSADFTASVVRSDVVVNPDSFHYAYETSNGIAASADAVVKNFNSENAAQEVKGQFSYPGDDGKQYSINYVADENGFQPQGDHLPVPPAIPELIQRSLEYNAAHPQAEDKYVNTGARATAFASSAPVAVVPKPSKPANKPFPYRRA